MNFKEAIEAVKQGHYVTARGFHWGLIWHGGQVQEFGSYSERLYPRGVNGEKVSLGREYDWFIRKRPAGAPPVEKAVTSQVTWVRSKGGKSPELFPECWVEFGGRPYQTVSRDGKVYMLESGSVAIFVPPKTRTNRYSFTGIDGVSLSSISRVATTKEALLEPRSVFDRLSLGMKVKFLGQIWTANVKFPDSCYLSNGKQSATLKEETINNHVTIVEE